MNKKYGDILNFQENDYFELPDLQIKFLGKTKVKNSKFIHKFFKYYDYEVSNNEKSIVVSWTSGTGIITPGNFEFDGKKWVLDMTHKDGIKIIPFDNFDGFSVSLNLNRSYKDR